MVAQWNVNLRVGDVYSDCERHLIPKLRRNNQAVAIISTPPYFLAILLLCTTLPNLDILLPFHSHHFISYFDAQYMRRRNLSHRS